MQLCFFVLFLNGVMLWKGIVVNLRLRPARFILEKNCQLIHPQPRSFSPGEKDVPAEAGQDEGNPLYLIQVFYTLTLLRVCNRSQILIFRSKIQI